MTAAIIPRALKRRSSSADYAALPRAQGGGAAAGRFIGIGIGSYVEGTGLGPFEGATVRFAPSGAAM